MVDSIEFLRTFGSPQGGRLPQVTDVAPWHNRVPEDLITFWLAHGTGSYGGRNLWLTMALEAEDMLYRRLGPIFDRPAIFALGAHGQLHLWTTTSTHLMLDLGTGLIMDMTSLGRTAPIPYDAADLALAVGVTKEAFVSAFLQGRDEPEDLWAVLFSLVSGDSEDSERPSTALLERTLGGPLTEGEHFVSPDPTDPLSWRRTTLVQSCAELPSPLRLVRYVLAGEQQVPVEDTITLNP
ncbi:GAD-like domain-containing protein [Roseinatronobacter alkalisoli]|uniref:GAD-like domain-containing protein n=1 Tax=Roseinatronobacter alkalisoli TaxID=3028235 RepID=A0ABT5TFV3_9RHOB|nr:GAD-like domain-containing protein [Roseinatronobacter sp. HJB301]MDD7974008.1 GAD-like domain-containing protein [Roseinatronobacter sp. HJB301]